MQSPWSSDYRNRNADLDDLRSERSTSAPPPETSLFFGRNDNNSYLGGNGRTSDSKFNPVFEHRNGGSNEMGSLFLSSDIDRRGASSSQFSSYDNGPPGFQSDIFSNGMSKDSNLSSSFTGNSRLASLDRRSIGESIIRSQSAAPSLDGRLSMGPPPGLATSETPMVSNRSGGTGESYLESPMDRSRIIQLAQQRPASTGIIGDHSSSPAVLNSLGLGGRTNGGGDQKNVAVRPAAKTLMDLIQEDYPPESPLDPTGFGMNYPREEIYLDRPRTTSPLSSSPYIQDDNGGLTEALDRLRINVPQNNAYGTPDQRRSSPQYITVDRGTHPQGDGRAQSVYAPAAQQILSPNVIHSQQTQFDQQSGYIKQTQVHQQTQILHQHQGHQQPQVHQQHQGQQQTQVLQHHQIHQQPQIHQQGQVQQQHQIHQQPQIHQQGQVQQQHQIQQQPQIHQQQLQAHVLPNGQTVYVNASPAPYGYTTVQYHPLGQQQQQHQLVHQTIPGGMPGEQYISVVPIQGGVPGNAAVPGNNPNGTYTYWPQDGQYGGAQTVTIVNPRGHGGVPVQVTRVGNSPSESPRHQPTQNHGGRAPKEKGGGKQKRGGGASHGRRGAEAKTPTNGSSCALLEEFKSKKNRDWTARDIKGFVVEFCQDQNGSRFIQQRLEVGDNNEKEIVMAEVLPAVRRLRNDVFGNYVVQKLLDFGTQKMKTELRATLQGEMLQLSLQMYGCRVVQKALETLDEPDLPRLLTEFHNNVLSCIHDQNGNHVIQKCIEVISGKAKDARDDGDRARADFLDEQIDFIVDDVLGNVASLSCHPYGCRVLQRILEHCIEPKKSRALDEIAKCHKTLLDDQYGNYVIQHVLQFGRHDDRESVLHIVAQNGLLILSRQKFASNVVEKLLKYGTAQQRKAVVREMLKVIDDQSGALLPAGSEGTSVVLLMVRDAYANYVVQTALDIIPECEEKRMLLEELNAHSTELKNYTFAKHIVTKLGA